MSKTCVSHDVGNVRKVEVDHTGNIDQFGDGLNTAAKNIVGDGERIHQRKLGFGCFLESVVGDDEQGVYIFTQTDDAGFCLIHSALAFKGEGLGDDSDRQNTELTCDLCDNGSCTCTGTAAHTCGDEDHVGTFDGADDLVTAVLGCMCTDIGVGTCALTLGDLVTDVDLDGCVGLCECLNVRIDGDERNTLDVAFDHAVDCVITAAADTDYLYIDNAGFACVKFEICHD